MYNQKDFLAEQIELIKQEISKNELLLADPDLGDLAATEIQNLNRQKNQLLQSASPEEKDETAPQNKLILEIRSAAGGEEAGLFASELWRMYERYAEIKHWHFKVVSMNEGGIGNLKEGVATIEGKDCYKMLQYESGVHRVQRVPKTESSGRIHTSTATVAVLPLVEENEFEVDPKDLKIDFYRAGGHGGQNVNKVETAVRITHVPTGFIVTCQDERTQVQNRTRAMQVLRSRLFILKKEQEKNAVDETRKNQVGSGDRSEKIRTFNFPQDRLTDHRLGQSWHRIEDILNGNLDELITALENQTIDDNPSGNPEV